jgi:hypothetical protein
MNEWERWQQMKEVLHHALEREPSGRADPLSWRFSIKSLTVISMWEAIRSS